MKSKRPRNAIFPGTFDPVTNGHLDLMVRALKLFDGLVVGVAPRDEKGVLFSWEERLEMLRLITRPLKRVQVIPFEGLLVDFARRQGIGAVVRGLRAVSDFEYEFQMALMNRQLSPALETVFLMPSEHYTYLNSTVVKEIARLGGDVSGLVPKQVVRRLAEKLQRKGRGK